MRKHTFIKRAVATILAMCMMVGMGTTVFAEDGENELVEKGGEINLLSVGNTEEVLKDETVKLPDGTYERLVTTARRVNKISRVGLAEIDVSATYEKFDRDGSLSHSATITTVYQFNTDLSKNYIAVLSCNIYLWDDTSLPASQKISATPVQRTTGTEWSMKYIKNTTTCSGKTIFDSYSGTIYTKAYSDGTYTTS